MFNRLGNHNSFQALADNSGPAPGRIAFGGKGGHQQSGGGNQGNKSHGPNQQGFNQSPGYQNAGHSGNQSFNQTAGSRTNVQGRTQQNRCSELCLPSGDTEMLLVVCRVVSWPDALTQIAKTVIDLQVGRLHNMPSDTFGIV